MEQQQHKQRPPPLQFMQLPQLQELDETLLSPQTPYYPRSPLLSTRSRFFSGYL